MVELEDLILVQVLALRFSMQDLLIWAGITGAGGTAIGIRLGIIGDGTITGMQAPGAGEAVGIHIAQHCMEVDLAMVLDM
jgi:hypothetical protein